MRPELFRIPFLNLPVYSYGLMLVIGFLAIMEVAQRLARKKGLNPDVFVNAALLALLAGIVGARISHILENIGEFTDARRSVVENLYHMVNIRSGGLTYYGGFLLATPVLIWYAVSKKVPVRVGMDIVAVCVMIGLGFGRIGCFLNGCCYGAECNLPWAVHFPMVPGSVHPAQLYSAFTAFLLAALLWSYWTLSPSPGRVFALMLMLEGGTRFILEMLRVEPGLIGRLSLSMVIGLGLVTAGIVLWIAWGGAGYQTVASQSNGIRAGSPSH